MVGHLQPPLSQLQDHALFSEKEDHIGVNGKYSAGPDVNGIFLLRVNSYDGAES